MKSTLVFLTIVGLFAGTTVAETGAGCTVCNFVVKEVAALLQKGEPNIEGALGKVCAALGPLSSVCSAVIDKELNNIISWLQDGDNEEAICERLSLCPKAVENVKGVECSVCKEIVHLVSGLLSKSEPEIEAEVNKLCAKLGPLASTCKKIADGGLDKIVAWLKAGENQETICKKLHACTTVENQLHQYLASHIQKQENVGGIECTICEKVVGLVSGLIHSSKAKIEEEVNKLCSELGPFASTCRSFVDKGLDNIIAWLKAGENQRTICSKLHAC
jgi:hypothetical protein